MPGRDDDLDLIKGLSVDRDDSDHYRHTGRGKGRQKPESSAGTGSPGQSAPAQKNTSKSGGIGWVAGLIILMLTGITGWLAIQFMDLQQQLVDTNSSLQLARTRMDDLGQQVYTTGSSVSESGNTIEKKFNVIDSEIRKLWDVSNKRNKAWITDNTAAVEKQANQLKSIESGLKDVAKDTREKLSKLDSLVASQAKVDKKLQQLSSEFRSENTASRATLDDLREQVLLVRGELEQMQIRLNQLPRDLPSRFEENEEAIKAIDATRQQLVESVTQLQSRVNQLQLSIGQGN